MIKFFESSFECKIIIDGNISKKDVLQLSKLFDSKYNSFYLEFINIYVLPSALLNLLYTQKEIKKKKIAIVVHKSKLSRYLYTLGINSHFISQLKNKYKSNPSPKIIAIGGSADSGEKIIEILSHIDTRKFIIFIIQHVLPQKDGTFDEILSRYVSAKVSYAKDGKKVKKGHIYIAQRDKHMLVKDNTLILDDSQHQNSARPSISVSFNSLSDEYKENLLSVLECGYGSDGVDSLDLLRKNNSTIIIQDPKGCKANMIVKEAVRKKVFDFVFCTHDIVSYINTISLELKTDDEWIKYLLDEIFIRYEYDFRFYQISLIKRRVEAFMIKHRIKDIKHMVILVLYFKSAFKSLFLEVSINVTEFFRNVKSSMVMLEVLQEYKNNYNIKIWCAGCSSGEEAYSSAIILNELGMLEQSLIYATDFNPIVIQEAKNGIYPIEVFKKANQKYDEFSFNSSLDKYFKVNRMFVEIRETIKTKVMFFVHNLERDSAFNEFDIIECKNVLIYFNEELQDHVFKLFYDSLKFGGYLFLGSSETLPRSFEDRFKIYDKKYKTYKKVS